MGGRGRVSTYINVLLVTSTYYLYNNDDGAYRVLYHQIRRREQNQPLTSAYCTIRPQLFNVISDLNITCKLLYSPVIGFAGKCARYISKNVVLYMFTMQHHNNMVFVSTGFYTFLVECVSLVQVAKTKWHNILSSYYSVGQQ